jgi:hypothetical protein
MRLAPSPGKGGHAPAQVFAGEQRAHSRAPHEAAGIVHPLSPTSAGYRNHQVKDRTDAQGAQQIRRYGSTIVRRKHRTNLPRSTHDDVGLWYGLAIGCSDNMASKTVSRFASRPKCPVSGEWADVGHSETTRFLDGARRPYLSEVAKYGRVTATAGTIRLWSANA